LSTINLLILFGKRRKEELTEQWMGSVIVSVYKKGYKTGFSKYRGISLFCMSVKLGLSH